MFAYIKGILAYSSPLSVIVEARDIGYKIFVPVSAFSHLPQIGTEVVMHLSFVVREQAHTLYGFLSAQERDFFEALLNVTGIGPRTALALIGHMPLAELQNAIIHQDVPAICRVPGIGKKGAERLIIEMRDKIPASAVSSFEISAQSPFNAKTQTVNDAMSALINLGYNQQTAQKALKKSLKDAPEEIDLASLIATALKHV
jgi:holliday junction DNA helicase RuvA